MELGGLGGQLRPWLNIVNETTSKNHKNDENHNFSRKIA